MTLPDRWKNPKPPQDVMDLLGEIQQAAARGHIRALAVVTINPNLKVETAAAGDDDPVRRDLLLSGLIRSTSKLSNPE